MLYCAFYLVKFSVYFNSTKLIITEEYEENTYKKHILKDFIIILITSYFIQADKTLF